MCYENNFKRKIRISNLLSFFNSLAEWSSNRVEFFGAQYVTFALFGLLNYPFAFLVLYYFESQENESLGLRLLACFLCIPLFLHRHWPHKIKRYLPLYWHAVVLFSIPFFAMVMLLRNSFSLEWLLNMLLGIFLFILLVDWLSFLILLSLGGILGFLYFQATGGNLNSLLDEASLGTSISLIFYLYFYAVIIGLLFARNREKIYEAKLQTVKSLAFSIAHEMRTPLACIAVGASSLRKFLPIYTDSYQKAQAAGLEIGIIHPNLHVQLKEIPLTMEKVSYNAQNIINMLLMKVKDAQPIELVQCLMSKCIQLALDQYPLSDEEKTRIQWNKSHDFVFLCKEEMVVHVFFNLFKNSLYQISQVPQSQIYIWSECSGKYNLLHFKDTGNGISKKMLLKIFDRFVTGTEMGTGMGLAYCKMAMNSFGGDIECFSEEGQGAEFILSFPKVDEENNEKAVFPCSIGTQSKVGTAISV